MNIDLPVTALNDITGQVTNGLSSFKVIPELIIGIILAFFLIGFIIQLFRPPQKQGLKDYDFNE